MGAMASQITILNTVYSTQVQIKQNIKALRHWLFCEELTGDLWITFTNDQ